MRRATAAAGSAVFFVLAPGTVAGLVPWLLTRWQAPDVGPAWLPVRVGGGLLAAAGLLVVLQAFARFVTEGLGTPAPVAPPQHLVVGGLYRYVRNPMYVAVLAIVLGQALLLLRPVLVTYAAVVWLAFATFVRWYEEPVLHRQFGTAYARYRAAVPPWIPRLSPWEPAGDREVA